MLRAIRNRLPLILATWISLFIGVQSATSFEYHELGAFGVGDNWKATLSIDEDDGAKSCMLVNTNPADETFALTLKEDGTAQVNLLYETLIVDEAKTLDIELQIGKLTWTLEDTRFMPDSSDNTTFAMFDFGTRDRINEFMDDLTGAPVVTLHEPGDDEPFSVWLFDGYDEALERIRQCRSYITATSQDESPRPEPRPASTSELKPGEKRI